MNAKKTEEVNLILSLPAGLIQASQRRGVEISTGQSSFLPGKFPQTEALKDPVRALDPLPRGALTVCPVTPCPPWAQSVIVNFQWVVITLLNFKALVSFAKLLEPLLHCMFISSSWAKCIVDVVSCLCCFLTYFELK